MRPKEDISTLPEGWQNEVIELYKEGANDVEVKAWIHEQRGRFSNDLWERWINEEPEFSETIKRGRMLSESWWLKEGRLSLRDNRFNSVLWYMNMKNRFGWADRQEIEQTLKASVDIKPHQWIKDNADS